MSDELVSVPARRIDLDAARRARAEARREAGEEELAPPVVVLDGVEYPLPPELPVGAALS